MKVTVLFFSQLRDICGVEQLDLEIDEAPTIGELLESLYQRFDGLQKWDSRILIAADHEYVSRDALVVDGQEIAIMPPVQGG